MSSRLSAFAALNNSESESDSESVLEQKSQSVGSYGEADDNDNNCMELDLGLGNSNIIIHEAFQKSTPPILNSNFAFVENENVIFNSDHQIIGLNFDDILIVKGTYKLSIIYGILDIDSYLLNDSNVELVINASNLNALPCIKVSQDKKDKLSNLKLPPFEKSFNCIIKLSNFDDNIKQLPNLYPHLKFLYDSDNSKNTSSYSGNNYTFTNLFEPESNKFAISISSYWNINLLKISSSLISSKNNQVILTIGNKNSGKSTFIKLLANTLLSNKSLDKTIQILDMDPGQPEFCLPGCISLCKISNPIIGTIEPFKFLKDNEIIKFIGFTSPSIQPLNYLNQLNKLLDIIKKNSLNENTITLINLPGWVKGFGIEIISNLISNIEISYLIQLSEELKDLDILKEINWDYNTKIIKLPSINKSNFLTNFYSPLFIRNFKLLSYMHYNYNLKNFNFNPLILKSPLRISYLTSTNDINKILKFNGIIGISIFDSQGILKSDLIQSLECQYMALLTIKSENLLNLQKKITNFQNLISVSNDSPNFFNENLIQSLDMKFYGLSIVHSIDIKLHCLNLYTPIDLTELKNNLITNNEKLILVKGREEVPMEEIYSTQISKGHAKYWDNFDLNCPPYISASLGTDVLGGKTVGIRRNIQRR